MTIEIPKEVLEQYAERLAEYKSAGGRGKILTPSEICTIAIRRKATALHNKAARLMISKMKKKAERVLQKVKLNSKND